MTENLSGVNKKYIPKNTRTQGTSNPNGKGKQPKGLDKLIENQM